MCKDKFYLLSFLMIIPLLLSATVYVDDDYTSGSAGGHTWQVDAFDNIQDAVDAYPLGVDIEVYAGTYQSTANSVVSLVAPSTQDVEYTIKGEGIENTIIDGESSRRCISLAGYHSSNDDWKITLNLVDLAIKNGLASIGGGVCGTGYNSLIIKECLIDSNSATTYGGGIYSYGGGECIDNYLSIEDSEISNNTSACGGGVYYKYGRATYINIPMSSTIFDNNKATSAEGGAIYTWRAILDFSDLEFTSNESATLGGALYSTYIGDSQEINEIYNCLFTDNTADTNGGAVYFNSYSGEIDFEFNTVYENYSTSGTGGIYNNGSTGSTLDVRNCIVYDNDSQTQVNNGGTGDLDIYYSCVENGTTTNGNITSGPRINETSDYSLYYYSPCIDSGDPSTTYNDADGSRADMGWKYHPQDIYSWQYGQIERTFLWCSFPKLPLDPAVHSFNDGDEIGVSNAWESWQPVPDGLDTWFEDYTFVNGSYDDQTCSWTWNINNDIASTRGYKLKKDNGAGCLMFSRGLKCLDNTTLETEAYSDVWLGYFLEDSQPVLDAFPSAVINDAIMIKTGDWSISRVDTQSRWSGTPLSCYINYADCVVISTVDIDHEFHWQTPSRSTNRVTRPIAEHFSFSDDIDYIPIYAEFDENDMPDEIAVYVDDICRGAQVVEDTVCQICAHILEEEPGEEIEFAFWYEGRSQVERRSSYLVYNNNTHNYENKSLITGTPGIHYEVSFKDNHEEITPLQFNLNCYPNPFNPELAISFSTTESTEHTEITIFNVKGQKVKTLVNELLRPDDYNFIWKGDDNSGSRVSSGVYYVRLRVGSEVVNSKVVLFK